MGASLGLHTALSLYGTQLLRQFIDGMAGAATTGTLARLAGLYFFVCLGRLLGEGLTAYVGENVAWSRTNRVRSDLLLYVINLDIEFFNSHPQGVLLERTNGDSNQLAYFFSQFSLRFLRSALLLTGITLLVAFEDWRVCLVVLGFVGTLAYLIFRLRSFSVPQNEKLREAASQLYGFIEEKLAALEDIEALGGITYSLRQMEELLGKLVCHGRLSFSLGKPGLANFHVHNWSCSRSHIGLGRISLS